MCFHFKDTKLSNAPPGDQICNKCKWCQIYNQGQQQTQYNMSIVPLTIFKSVLISMTQNWLVSRLYNGLQLIHSKFDASDFGES